MRPDVKHYKTGAIEPIDYIISNDLSFAEGNVVKYITRYKHKGTPVEDLKKARDYINFILESLEDKTKPTTTTFSTSRVSIEDLIEALKRGPVLLTNSILLYEILRDKVEYTVSNCKYIMYFKNKKYTVRIDTVTNDTREYTLVREQDKITIGGIA